MDLNEAEKSFDYFTDLLKMQCAQMTLALDMEAKAASTEMAAQATEVRNQALASLQELYKNAQILSILVCEEMGKQAARLVCVPLELAKVMRGFKPSGAGIPASAFAYRGARKKTGSKKRAEGE